METPKTKRPVQRVTFSPPVVKTVRLPSRRRTTSEPANLARIWKQEQFKLKSAFRKVEVAFGHINDASTNLIKIYSHLSFTFLDVTDSIKETASRFGQDELLMDIMQVVTRNCLLQEVALQQLITAMQIFLISTKRLSVKVDVLEETTSRPRTCNSEEHRDAIIQRFKTIYEQLEKMSVNLAASEENLQNVQEHLLTLL